MANDNGMTTDYSWNRQADVSPTVAMKPKSTNVSGWWQAESNAYSGARDNGNGVTTEQWKKADEEATFKDKAEQVYNQMKENEAKIADLEAQLHQLQRSESDINRGIGARNFLKLSPKADKDSFWRWNQQQEQSANEAEKNREQTMKIAELNAAIKTAQSGTPTTDNTVKFWVDNSSEDFINGLDGQSLQQAIASVEQAMRKTNNDDDYEALKKVLTTLYGRQKDIKTTNTANAANLIKSLKDNAPEKVSGTGKISIPIGGTTYTVSVEENAAKDGYIMKRGDTVIATYDSEHKKVMK